jgi:hypothetical protein
MAEVIKVGAEASNSLTVVMKLFILWAANTRDPAVWQTIILINGYQVTFKQTKVMRYHR